MNKEGWNLSNWKKNEHMTESDPGLAQGMGTFNLFLVTEWFFYFLSHNKQSLCI